MCLIAAILLLVPHCTADVDAAAYSAAALAPLAWPAATASCQQPTNYCCLAHPNDCLQLGIPCCQQQLLVGCALVGLVDMLHSSLLCFSRRSMMLSAIPGCAQSSLGRRMLLFLGRRKHRVGKKKVKTHTTRGRPGRCMLLGSEAYFQEHIHTRGLLSASADSQ